MSTVEVGRVAETQVSTYLEGAGYQIIARNWRNRWCELDIVARRRGVIHFVEVKYRADTRYGYAAEYVSRDKTARLIRAASAWCQAHSYQGAYQIDVVSVEGSMADPAITHLENAIGSF